MWDIGSFGVGICQWRNGLLPTYNADGHLRSVTVPLPFKKTLYVDVYSWKLPPAETEPLIAGPIECARCGEEFDDLTARTMHVIRKRCPEIDTDADVDAADTAHAIEEPFR